ncbi:MAG: hypothetical protein OEY28_09305 [Nitrospira sp.]|nr:hypothetical protein [Nitrospira sp.]
MRNVLLILLLVTTGLCEISAQTLTVELAPFSPAERMLDSNEYMAEPVAAFMFTASGGDVDVLSLAVTTGGNADWVTGLDPLNGFEIRLDNGDTQLKLSDDTLLYRGSAATPLVAAQFSSPLSVVDGTSVDIWVVVKFLPQAGGSAGMTYVASVAGAADVGVAAAASVLIGPTTPAGEPLLVVDYFVTDMVEVYGPPYGIDADKVELIGSGFQYPISAWLGEYQLVGNPEIVDNGTRVTGLFIDWDAYPEFYTVLAVDVSSGTFGRQPTGIYRVNPWGGDWDAGCATRSAGRPGGYVVALLLSVAVVYVGRRTRRRRR